MTQTEFLLQLPEPRTISTTSWREPAWRRSDKDSPTWLN